MRVDIRLIIIVLVVVAMTYFMEVESRRHHSKHPGKDAAKSVMKAWQKWLKKMEGPSYKYWHRRKDANGKWHERKYGHSDSFSGSSSSSKSSESGSRSSSKSGSSSGSRSESGSNSKSGSHSGSESGEHHHHHGKHRHHHHHRKSESSSSSSEHRGQKGHHPVVTEAFILYGNAYGCNNLTAYQHFLASYTNGEGRADNLKLDSKDKEKDQLFKEMSKLAAEDLAKGENDDEDEDSIPQCNQSCPPTEKN